MTATEIIDRPPVLKVGPLEIDVYMRVVHVEGRRVELTPREYMLLVALAREPERAFTRLELARVMWNWPHGTPPRSRALDSAACCLRRKIGPQYVVNVWGVGYRLVEWAGRTS